MQHYLRSENICSILFVFATLTQAHVVFIDQLPFLIYLPYPLLFISFLFNKNVFTNRHIHAAVLFFIFLFYLQLNSSSISLTTIVYPVIITSFLLLKEKIIIRTFDLFISLLSIIIFLGFFFWFLSIIGGYSFYLGSCFIGERFYELYPFYVVEPIPGGFDFIFRRFNSIFDEPGMLGTICVLILCAKKFQISKDRRLIIILLGGILSMSLAFYIMTCLYIFFTAKLSIKYILNIIVLILLIIIINNLVDGYIGELFGNRLDVSNISELDNRTSDDFNFAFNRYLNSSKIYLGMGHNAHVGIGTSEGVKAFFYNYGYIGIFLLFLAFAGLVKSYNIKYNECALIIIYAMNFYQRAGIYRLYMLLPFVAGLIILSKNNIYENR